MARYSTLSQKTPSKQKYDHRKLEAKCKTIVQAKANKEILKKYPNLYSHLKIQALNV